MISFEKTDTQEKTKQVAELADEIWNEHYIKILTKQQIDYMLNNFQSEQALEEQIKSGYEYYLIFDNGIPAGYLGFCLKDDFLFLSKLYLKQEMRGKGLGRSSIEFAENYAKQNNISKIRLTVNKYNMTSVYVYNNLGFQKIDAVETDIGGGFIMDDYIMEKTFN